MFWISDPFTLRHDLSFYCGDHSAEHFNISIDVSLTRIREIIIVGSNVDIELTRIKNLMTLMLSLFIIIYTC